MSNLPFQFGEKVGFVSMTHPAVLGGAGGAVAGLTSGLIAPGEYEDDDGNIKRRSRLGSGLRRALLLGAGGAGAGMAYDYFSGPSPKLPPPFDRDAANAKNPFLTSQPTKMEQTMMQRFEGQADQRGDMHDQLDKPNPFLDLRRSVQDVKIPKQKNSDPTADADRGIRA